MQTVGLPLAVTDALAQAKMPESAPQVDEAGAASVVGWLVTN